MGGSEEATIYLETDDIEGVCLVCGVSVVWSQ